MKKKKCKYISKKKVRVLTCGKCSHHQTYNDLGDGQCCIYPKAIYRPPTTPICITNYQPN